jgi:hypothetical protein
MKKSVEKIELGWRLWSLIIGALIFVGLAGFSYAYGGTNPSIMGHPISEVEIPLCEENQILIYNSSKDLTCGETNSQFSLGSYELGNSSGGTAFKTYCPEGYVAVGLDFKDRSDDHTGSKLVCAKLN